MNLFIWIYCTGILLRGITGAPLTGGIYRTEQWPTFSFYPYNSGYFGNYGQAQHANELSQLQKTVKSLEEKLASVSSSNKQVSHDDFREVSRKKKRRFLHEISDSDDALSDISSEELDVWSGSENGQTEDGFQMPFFSDLSTVKACSNTSDKLTSKTLFKNG